MSGLNAAAIDMLKAVLALGLWTFVMSSWMGPVRLVAMGRAKIPLQDAAHVADLRPRLPSWARRVADNYNHLLEAPTVFYAATLAVVLMRRADQTGAILAWSFVGLRIVHSLVQATFNRVAFRVVPYVVSWFVLAALMVRPLLAW